MVMTVTVIAMILAIIPKTFTIRYDVNGIDQTISIIISMETTRKDWNKNWNNVNYNTKDKRNNENWTKLEFPVYLQNNPGVNKHYYW